MKNRRNDPRAFLIMSIVLTLLILSIVLWGAFDYLNTGKKEGIGIIFVGLIIALFGFKLLKDKYKSLKRGESLKDERSRKLEIKAAAYAFYIGIYWLLALSIIIDYFKVDIPARSVPSVGLAGMAILFGLAYWYFSKKGE